MIYYCYMDNTLKKRITISISADLYARLDKRNRSGDVENILTQHFQYENKEKLYDWLKNRLLKDPEFQKVQLSNTGGRTTIVDEELENYRINYRVDGFQFRRYNGQIQVNKPPSREWAGVEVLNY